MYPSTHDISPEHLEYSLVTIDNLLRAGNRVLIVSKPHLKCIQALCAKFGEYKDKILFRFTIGTLNPEVSKFWEPGTPLPVERIESLAYAQGLGFETSVSMESMVLGADDAISTFNCVQDYVTETVWIGKMNHARSRVDVETRPEFKPAVDDIERLQSDEEIRRLVAALKDDPKVQWKNTIKDVIDPSRRKKLEKTTKSTVDAKDFYAAKY